MSFELLANLIGDGPEVAEYATITDAAGLPVGPTSPAFTENFEGGTLGNDPTTGTVFSTGQNTYGLTIDNSQVYTGSQSVKFQTASIINSYVGFWFGTYRTSFYVRGYFRANVSQGAINGNLGVFTTMYGATPRAHLELNTSGQFVIGEFRNNINQTSGSYNDGNWWRLEWDIVDGYQELRIYWTSSGLLRETVTCNWTSLSFDSFLIGSPDSAYANNNSYGRYWIDDIAGDYSRNPSIATPISANDTGTLTDAAGLVLSPKSATETGAFTDVIAAKGISALGDTVTSIDAVSTRTANILANEPLTSLEGSRYSTFQLTDGDTGRGVERDTPNRIAVSKWRFTPPSTPDLFQMEQGTSFYVQINEGYSVLKKSGTYTLVSTPLPEDMAAADVVYFGGRSYAVDDTEIAALTAAGYGAYLALVPEPS